MFPPWENVPSVRFSQMRSHLVTVIGKNPRGGNFYLAQTCLEIFSLLPVWTVSLRFTLEIFSFVKITFTQQEAKRNRDVINARRHSEAARRLLKATVVVGVVFTIVAVAIYLLAFFIWNSPHLISTNEFRWITEVAKRKMIILLRCHWIYCSLDLSSLSVCWEDFNLSFTWKKFDPPFPLTSQGRLFLVFQSEMAW